MGKGRGTSSINKRDHDQLKGGEMKKNVWITTLLVVFLIFSGSFLVLPSSATAADQAAIAGTWNARGKWAGGGSWESTWTILQDGRFFDLNSTSGGTASGTTVGPAISFIFDGGCFPVYRGIATRAFMFGRMVCTQGEGSGAWIATRAMGSADLPEYDGEAGGADEASP
jgi:hypothetical protein